MKRKLSIFLVVLLSLSMLAAPVLAATEAELQQQKDAAEEKKEAAEYQIDMTQTTIEGIESEIEKANAQIETIQGDITAQEKQISTMNANVKQLTADLAKAEKEQAEQEAMLEERVRVMYMYGNEGYAEVLFSSNSFSDLISKVDMMQSIISADQASISKLEATVQSVTEKKTAIEEAKVQVESAKAAKETALKQQESVKTQKDALLAKNKSLINTYEKEVAEQESAISNVNDQLSAIAAEAAAKAKAAADAKAAEEAASGNSGGSGSADSGSGSSGPSSSAGLIWPVSSAYYPDEWDDMFGTRIHPLFGTTSWHSGCDMGAPTGTPVWSAGNGTVVLAGVYGGYGNCIMIAVDGGTVLYGHLSAIYVSEGQSVSQGETVGAVGSTGWSTGPHLHLSFLVGGDYVDPLDYMSW